MLNDPKKVFSAKRSQGWGIGLFRDAENGKIGGVCAGIAQWLELDRRWIRLAVLIACLMHPGVIFTYAFLWLILDVQPQHQTTDAAVSDDETETAPTA